MRCFPITPPIVPVTWLWLLLISGLGVGSSRADDGVVVTGETMGTTYRIRVLADAGDSHSETSIQDLVDRRLQEIDRRMSTYRDDSDVSRFNRAKEMDWVSVHPETAQVVSQAIAISRETNGAFDCTVGPIVDLWNFGPSRAEGFEPPRDTVLDEALKRIGYQHLEARVDENSAALRKTIEGLCVDLSGIAKGYAVDAVIELLRKQGIRSAMVEVGGEVRVLGTKHGAPWRIGIESPVPHERRVHSVVPLESEAMASSGDYRNFFVHNGTTYSHTIDPRTGQPVASRLAGVTVVAPSCARADALATALMVLGDNAFEWAQQRQLQALFLTRNEDDSILQTTTSTFPRSEATKSMSRASFPMLALAAVVVFGLAILSMSLGTIIANKRLQGSCGGMAGLKDQQGRTLCDMCTRPSPECAGTPNQEASEEQLEHPE